jgi:hypothetical protein
MKHLLKTCLASFILCALIIGCDEDDDRSSNKNSLKVGGSEHALSGGILSRLDQYQDNDGSYYGFRLYLFSKSITPDVYSKWEIGFDGTGQILEMDIAVLSESLENGQYSFDSTFPYQRPSFRGEYSLDNETQTIFSSGTLTVSKNGDEYEFTLNGTDKNGDTVTGYYKGNLSYYE